MANVAASVLIYEVEKRTGKDKKSKLLLLEGKTREILTKNIKISYGQIIKYKSIRKPI